MGRGKGTAKHRPSSSATRSQFEVLRRGLERLLVGEERVLHGLLACLLGNGAMLLEGRPGLAEQRVAKRLAEAIGARFASITLTPDLAPSDLAGALRDVGIEHKSAGGAGTDVIKPSVLLVREIDSGPRKIQALLLDACDDGKLAVDGRVFLLPPVFMLVATQNTVDRQGPYPLSAEQRDRFLVHVPVDWMEESAERAFLRMSRVVEKGPVQTGEHALAHDTVLAARSEVTSAAVESAAEKHIVSLIVATRSPERHGSDLRRWIAAGVGLRGTIALDRAARAHAWLGGRDAATPADVHAVAPDVLRHRLVLTKAAADLHVTSDDVVRILLEGLDPTA